jgi:hypothetical protein
MATLKGRQNSAFGHDAAERTGPLCDRTQETGNAFLEVACIALLLAAFVRLLPLGIAQWHEFEAIRNRSLPDSPRGTLQGVDGQGRLLQPADVGYTLVFVLHARRLPADVAFWNAVVDYLRGHSAHPASYIAVCDSGLACRGAEGSVRFSVMAFMDPLAMQGVAGADRGKKVLLYRQSFLKGTTETSSEPLATARAIAKSME